MRTRVELTRIRSLAVLATATLALTAGCAEDTETSVGSVVSAAPPSSTGSPAPSPGQDAFPVTLTHALGTTVIPSKPTRIVTLSFEQDLLATIDIEPVGHRDNFDTPGELYPWQQGTVSLAESEVVTSPPDGNPQLEKIAALDPDLILATEFFSLPEYYDKLAQIAPTLGYETAWGAATWQETAEVIGRAVGESAAIADVVADLEGYISDVAAQFPGLQGKHHAGAYHHASQQFAVNANPQGHAARLFAQLGLQYDPDLAAAVENNSLSMEKIGLLDSDLLIVSYASPELREELESNPLFADLDVVRDGRYYAQDNAEAYASNNPTVLNIRWLLERRRDLFTAVAAAATPLPTSTSTSTSN